MNTNSEIIAYESQKERCWQLSGQLAHAASLVVKASVIDLSIHISTLVQQLVKYDDEVMILATMKNSMGYTPDYSKAITFCPKCGKNLEQIIHGVRGSCVIGVSDRDQDKIIAWRCPDCGYTWDT